MDFLTVPCPAAAPAVIIPDAVPSWEYLLIAAHPATMQRWGHSGAAAAVDGIAAAAVLDESRGGQFGLGEWAEDADAGAWGGPNVCVVELVHTYYIFYSYLTSCLYKHVL